MAATSSSSDLTGTVLGGRYRVKRLIGAGGMGSVYEAVQEDLGRRVAIKVVHPHLLVSKELLQRFRREAQAAAALGHPNIVQITDFESNPDEPAFLVMEYLVGCSLGDVLREERPMSAARVAFIASQTLAALGASHAAGIVHRDIKPDNIFLTSIAGVGDIVKVLDFGVAKLAEEGDTRLTSTGAMVGTPMYMAPEQARGREVDARSDVYAVGACMYHALSGRTPFDAPSFNALLFAIAEDLPAPLAASRPDLPPAFVAVIERALAKKPDDRFATAEEMRAALGKWAVPSASGANAVERVSHPADPLAATAVAPPPTPVRMLEQSERRRQAAKTAGTAQGTTQLPPAREGLRLRVWVSVAAVSAVGLLFAVWVGTRSTESGGDGVAANASRRSPTVEAKLTGTASEVATGVVAWSSASFETPLATTAPSSTQPVTTMPTSSATAARVVASSSASAVSATTTATGTAPPSAVPHIKQTAGRVAHHVGGSWTGSALTQDAYNAAVRPVMGAVNSCFASAQYDPGNHKSANYVVTVNAAGVVIGVAPPGNNEDPNLDRCMFAALRAMKFENPTAGDAGVAQLTYNFYAPIRE